MKYSLLLGKTLRQKPKQTVARSHELLLRGGFIFPVAAGIYDFLPLGFRVLEKIDKIIKQEFAKRNIQHLLMPFVHPASLWQETGRFEKMKDILAVFEARHGGEYLLAPTHEETVTDLARNFIFSYKDLPVIVNQNQWKYRDEIRVSGGLLRTREFLMQDAYSFDMDEKGLAASFSLIKDAYMSIFDRMELDVTVVRADSGAIGGEGSEEFMLISDSGEDKILTCDKCDYKANLEAAISIIPVFNQSEEKRRMKAVEGKGLVGVEALAKFLNIPVEKTTKTLLYLADGSLVAVCIRGDYSVNEVKLANILNASSLVLASEKDIKKLTGSKVGYAGPIGLPERVKVIWDETTKNRINFECGANKTDYHNINVNFGRDLAEPDKFFDIRNVEKGEICAICKKGLLKEKKTIELAHIFKLGTIYSEKMKAFFIDKNGDRKPIMMGCYGIGMTRLLAASVDSHNDENGIIWPKQLTPFDVHLVSLPGGEKSAQLLYKELISKGFEVLWDDREDSAGVKFSDADLIGIPKRIVVSAKTGDKAELKDRSSDKERIISFDELIDKLKIYYSNK